MKNNQSPKTVILSRPNGLNGAELRALHTAALELAQVPEKRGGPLRLTERGAENKAGEIVDTRSFGIHLVIG